jgi:hypothetical protein
MVQVLRYAAFAEESEYNEDPTPEPVMWADIASATLDTPSDTELTYEGGLSRGVRLHRPGFYAPSGNVVYADSVDTIHRAFRWALGGYAFTGDSPLNLHESYATEFIDQEQGVPSFATRIGKDIFEHRFRGCVVNSLELAVEDSFAQVTLDIASAQDEKGALDDTVIDKLAATPPFVFHEVFTSLSGVDASAYVRAFTLNIQNNADSDAGRSLGSRHPRRMPWGNRRINVTMNVWYEDTSHIERVWGGATGPVPGGSTELPVVATMDAGVDGLVVMTMPRVLWTGVSTTPSGQGRIEQTINAMAYLEPVTLDDGVTEVQTELLAATYNDQADITA